MGHGSICHDRKRYQLLLSLWFNVTDGKLFGRGASDDKGPALSWLHAVQMLQKHNIELPVNMKVRKTTHPISSIPVLLRRHGRERLGRTGRDVDPYEGYLPS